MSDSHPGVGHEPEPGPAAGSGSSREAQLEAALRDLADWLHVDMSAPGLSEGRPTLYGGPGRDLVLCVSSNSWWDGMLGAISVKLDEARKLLQPGGKLDGGANVQS